jgi:hypothetical protein
MYSATLPANPANQPLDENPFRPHAEPTAADPKVPANLLYAGLIVPSGQVAR